MLTMEENYQHFDFNWIEQENSLFSCQIWQFRRCQVSMDMSAISLADCRAFVLREPSSLQLLTFSYANMLNKFLLNKSHVSEYGIYCSMLKWCHLMINISIIDTSIYVSKFLLNKSRISDNGIYCSVLNWCHLITHIE